MPVIACADDVRPSRRRANSNGADFWLTTYIGANRYTSGAETSPEPGTIYPMAFLVEQDAGAIVGAHYHQADQFQVVVGGAGGSDITISRQPQCTSQAPGRRMARYRPARTDCNISRLRNGWDPGARYMEFPGNRATLRATHAASRGDG